MLNDGDGERFMKLWEKADDENAIYDYDTEIDEANKSEIADIKKHCVNRMIPLEDYEMKLHMYSDYIVRSQIFDQIIDRYPDDAFLQEQVEILTSIDNRE